MMIMTVNIALAEILAKKQPFFKSQVDGCVRLFQPLPGLDAGCFPAHRHVYKVFFFQALIIAFRR